MKSKKYIVYIHTNKLNNKCYVGITSRTVEQRWQNGQGYLQKKKGNYTQPKFANAILKYGWDNFEHIIWAENLTKEDACKAEKMLISMWDTINNGYNTLSGGQICECDLKKCNQTRFETLKQKRRSKIYTYDENGNECYTDYYVDMQKKGHIMCQRCYKIIKYKPNLKYCKECDKKVHNELAKSSYKPVGDRTVICIDCGKVFQVVAHDTRTIRCEECNKKERNKHTKELMRKKRNKNNTK